MKTLIVPDIHQKIDKLNRLLDRAGSVDKVIYLGDWFDDWNWTMKGVEETTEALLNTKGIKIWGNHDIHYTLNRFTPVSSGFNWRTQEYLVDFDWSDWVFAVEEQGWIISHAGFYNPDHIELAKSATLLNTGEFSPLFNIGRYRGGRAAKGGPLWLDWKREFEPLLGIKQIVGHTELWVAEQRDGNWNLDTKGNLNYYGILEDGELTVHENQ